MQKQGVHSTKQLGDHSPHIPPRMPIIDEDYELTQDDYDAAAFVQLSYQEEDLVEIGQCQLKAK